MTSERMPVLALLFAGVLLGLGPGCEGFFVDPVLTGITVGPATTIQTGNTIQMAAVGTFNDGSQNTLTSKVFWSSSTPSVATISDSGLANGVGPGQTTITGASGTVTGTATLTVTIGGLTAIQVSNQDNVTSITYGTSEQFIATGTANGRQFNLTNSVTWSTLPSSISNVNIASSTGLLTTTSGPTAPVQFQVVATDPTTNISNSMAFSVRP
jgi:Bacterial Ig-like domain (group 2)